MRVLLLSGVDEWLVANLAEHEGRALAWWRRASSISPKLQSDEEKKGGGEQATGTGRGRETEGRARRPGERRASLLAPHRFALVA